MTQVVSTHVSRNVGNRLGFKHKSPKGLRDDVKAACARLGRMDLYHAIVAARPSVRKLARLRGMSLGASSGTFPLEKFAHYVTCLGNCDRIIGGEHLDGHRNNQHYERRARRARGAPLSASRSQRAKAADLELAVPDLFPDDGAP